MITAQSMRPVEGNGPGQEKNLTTEMTRVKRTARKCTKIISVTLGAIMMSAALQTTTKQDSYVNLEVEEVINP